VVGLQKFSSKKMEVKKLHRSCLNEAFYSPGRFICFWGSKMGRKRSAICPDKLTGANGPAELPTLSVDGKVNTCEYSQVNWCVLGSRACHCLTLFGGDYVTVVLPQQKKKK
jgi:hypothetical protein